MHCSLFKVPAPRLPVLYQSKAPRLRERLHYVTICLPPCQQGGENKISKNFAVCDYSKG
jgi:hypothetical protein